MNTPLHAGHAPGHLRQAFEHLAETGDVLDVTHRGSVLTARRITGLLWNCTDVMPGSLCRDLDLSVGSSYAQGARRLR